MKVISYCLWGNNPKYLEGMKRNIQLAPKIYPGWTIFIYCGDLDYKYIKSLYDLARDKVQLYMHHEPINDWRLMLARFKAILDPDVDVMISRDADSRLSHREATAVAEWLDSDKAVHTMHDHPWHTVPILGGMWGCKDGFIPDFEDTLKSWPGEDKWQTDQEFLQQKVLPRVAYNVLNHDDFYRHIYGGIPFPTTRVADFFVGATVDENEMMVHEQVRELKRVIG